MRPTQTIAPNAHEKREWASLAQDAYARGFNDTGDRFTVASSLLNGEAMTPEHPTFEPRSRPDRNKMKNSLTSDFIAVLRDEKQAGRSYSPVQIRGLAENYAINVLADGDSSPGWQAAARACEDVLFASDHFAKPSP